MYTGIGGQRNDGSVEAIAAFRQRLDQRPVALVAAGMAQVSAQLVEAPGQGVVGDDGARPKRGEQVFAGNDVTGVLRHVQQHVHHLSVQFFAAPRS